MDPMYEFANQSPNTKMNSCKEYSQVKLKSVAQL
jgi:hypothetical protein